MNILPPQSWNVQRGAKKISPNGFEFYVFYLLWFYLFYLLQFYLLFFLNPTAKEYISIHRSRVRVARDQTDHVRQQAKTYPSLLPDTQ